MVNKCIYIDCIDYCTLNWESLVVGYMSGLEARGVDHVAPTIAEFVGVGSAMVRSR